ncbi:hypothetical protein [Halorussus ruber]|uniref:hypothetical protein n=1 Tax=Halorussus ruber TaxID=1126238 RepID=UPI001FE89D63|nr:hypothetical protein [Halorussus ruber]
MQDVTDAVSDAGSLRRGALLVGAGLLLVVAAFGGSWALAPDASVGGLDGNVTTLVGVQGPGPNGNVTALDGRGDVRWSLGDIISYQDVSHLENGSVLATYAAKYPRACGPYESPCKRTGVRIIDPPIEPPSSPTAGDPEIVYEWSYPVRTRRNSEVHDAELLPSGNLLVADMEYESLFVLNPRTRNRVWTWNASEFYDAPADPTETDWLHINDVDRIGEGRYLASVRNENELVVVERGKGVVDVINEDGDPDVLNRQHNPHWLGEGAVLVADSENHRVVELHENETTGEWEVAWSVATVGGIDLDWPRDADRLPNGHTLITDSRNNRVVEITRDGQVAASYRVPSLPYEADRVPYGERRGEPYRTGRRAESGLLDGRIPVLSTLLAGARHVVPIPFWVSEMHLLVVGVAGVLWLWGGVSMIRGVREKSAARESGGK